MTTLVVAVSAVVVAGCGTVTVGGAALPAPPVIVGLAEPVPTDDRHVVGRRGHPAPADGIGDPAALVTGVPGPRVIDHGRPVVPACAMLTPSDLAAVGLTIPDTGGIQVVLPDGSDDVEPRGEANSCSYPVGAEREPHVARVAVYRPGGREARLELQLFGRPVDRDGVQVRTSEPAAGVEPWYWLQVGDVAVELMTTLPDPVTRQELLHLVSRRLVESAADPPGPPTFGYDSPVFAGPRVDACSIGRWSDLGAFVAGTPSSGHRTSGVPMSIGVFRPDGGPAADYAASSCQMSGVVPERDDYDVRTSGALFTDTMTFDTAEAAAGYLAFMRGYPGAADTAPRAGDESIWTPGETPSTVYARKGRVVLRLQYLGGDNPTTGDPETAEAAAAAVMLARVEG